ncbi:hypothetical protein M3Y94_00091300 [Aphelenchoides besseyi]|nr:hypothetical protein M3Y94_00091300 [Aphelenchoides besseyi]
MRSTFVLILILSVVSFAPRSVEAKRDGKRESSAQPTGEIEQCQCDALTKCRAEAQKRQQPCIDKCKAKLRNRHWDQEAGKQCFDVQQNNEQQKCIQDVQLKTCAIESGVMLARNETMPWGRRRHSHRRQPRDAAEENDVNDEDNHNDHEDEAEDVKPPTQQHRPREHNKRAFYSFIRRHFGKSGNAFVRCMDSCGKQRVHDQCPRELKCGVKRIPRAEHHELISECHKKQQPRRYEVCNCLKNAGMNHLDCTFGRKDKKKNAKSRIDGQKVETTC